jgi:hypothetical protein
MWPNIWRVVVIVGDTRETIHYCPSRWHAKMALETLRFRQRERVPDAWSRTVQAVIEKVLVEKEA